MKRFNQVLLESSLARVFQHTKSRNIGMISASRSALSAQENNRRHYAMASDIRKLGYGFIKVKGRYIENFGKPNAKTVDEKAFLVVGKKTDDKGALLGHLKHLGNKYGQDLVLHKAYNSSTASLHGTNDTGYPGKGKSVEMGSWHPNRTGEFYAMMKNKSFKFGEDFVATDWTKAVFEFVTQISFFARQEHLF